MTLIEHFKDPYFWEIFFELSAWALLMVAILVVIFWINDRIEKKSLTLTENLNSQETWMKRFKK